MNFQWFIKNKIFFLLAFLFLMVLVILFFLIKDNQEIKTALILEEKNKKLLAEKKIIKERKIEKLFSESYFEAESILVQKINSDEIIWGRNIKKKQSIASLTKIITAFLVLENKLSKQGLGSLDIEIQEIDLEQAGEYFLQAGEIFSKKDALKFMLIVSSNDISRTLTNSIFANQKSFLKQANILAEKLELNSTLIFSDSGLDITDLVGGSYSSTQDISKLMTLFFKKYPEISQKTSLEKLKICSQKLCHQIKNTNILLPKKEILFSKTGFTDISGGNLGVIVKINNELYSIVVLNSSKKGRFQDVEKIIKLLYKKDELEKEVN